MSDHCWDNLHEPRDNLEEPSDLLILEHNMEGASYQLLSENLRSSFSMRVTIWEWRLTRENAAGSPWLFSVLPEPPKAGGTLLSVLPPDSPQPTQATASPPSPFSRPKQSGQIYICGIWTNIYLWNLDKDILKFEQSVHSVLLRGTLQGTASPPPPFWCRIQSFHSFAEKNQSVFQVNIQLKI